MMSTKLFQAANNKEYEKARNQFLEFSIPLLLSMLGSWYLALKWFTKGKVVEKKRAS